MAEDVDAEAERAANAARAAVKRANRAPSSLLPVLVIGFAILSLVALFMTDKDATQPASQPRVEGPTTTQPAN